MSHLRSLLAAIAVALYGSASWGASLPLVTGPQDPSQLQATVNQALAAVNAGVPGFAAYQGKNYLDNGAMQITQHTSGTLDTTGASTAGCVLASYPLDRWCVDTNVTTGVGHGQVITASPAPPPSFQKSVKIWRNSGALTQPVLLMQEIRSARAIALQGQSVIASCYVQPLAGYTGTAAISMNLMTGTGSDEGLGALRSAVGMTASPALTPAFTGVAAGPLSAGAGSPSWVIGTTAAWSRLYSAPFPVPVGATEAAFSIGFTPVGSSSGATDGMAITGCQLEVADPGQTVPSAFERRPYESDLAIAQAYFVQWSDGLASTFTLPSTCAETTANTVAACTLLLPVTMVTTPVSAVVTATSFGMTKVADGTAEACSTLAVVASTNSPNSVGLTCAASETAAVGTMHRLIYANSGATNYLTVSADF